MSDQSESAPRDEESAQRRRSTRWSGPDDQGARPSSREDRSAPRRDDDRSPARRDDERGRGGFERNDRRRGSGFGDRDRRRDDRRDGFRGRDDRGGYGSRNGGGRPERGRDDRGRDDRRGGRHDDRRGAATPEQAAIRGPRSWDRQTDERSQRRPEPELPETITGQELDKDVRQQLRTLSKENADGVAKHLVAAAEFLDEDPERALLHAQHAVGRAARVPAAREALGLVLYRNGDFAEALREFRTARRLSGSDHLLPYMVDCERGLGRYERALELANSPEAHRLSEADNIELAIVVSGVRRDMGQHRAAVVGLRIPALRKATTQPWAARLFYAYADALLDIDEVAEARQWFVKADKIDRDGETDAADRIDEIDGFEMTDLTPEDDQEVDPRLAELDLNSPFTKPEGGAAR